MDDFGYTPPTDTLAVPEDPQVQAARAQALAQQQQQQQQLDAARAAAQAQGRQGLDWATFGGLSALADLGGKVMGVDRYAVPSAPYNAPVDPNYRPTFMPAGGSPEQDLASGLTSSWADAPSPIKKEAPPAEAPPEQKKETPEDWMARMYKQLGGGVGAPTIKMNEYLKQGYNQQREAQKDMLPALQAEEATKAAARQGILTEGQNYVEGLKKLQAQQSDLFAGRRRQMDEDEARMRQAETSYDPSRVLRNIGEQPVASGILSFTAGLVGALKGAAGDMGPNEILGEVDKSVARDVDMQREHYKRMQAGIEHGRANFADAVKMGASEQEALGTAALASMDQHRRALEFAEARITDANKKAAIKSAIGGLNVEQGKLQYQMDTHNASNALSASKANRDLKLQLMGMAASRGQANPEMVKQADAAYDSLLKNPGFKGVTDKARALGNTLKSLGDMTPADVKKMWTSPIASAISGALASSEAKNAHDGSAVGTVVARALRTELESAQDPKKIRLLNTLQSFINFGIHDLHGATVSSQEAMRSELERSLTSPENFMAYMEQMANDTQDQLGMYKAAAMHNPELGKQLDVAFGFPVQGIKNWRQQQSAQQAAEDLSRNPIMSGTDGTVR